MSEAFPHQLVFQFDALKDFEDRLPLRTGCSHNKMFNYILPKEQAIGFPYIQINYPGIDYICFDLDYASAPVAAQERDLPGPTLTVISPDSYHAHLLYELLNPLPRKPTPKTKKLLKDVCLAYREVLCADKVITTQRQLVKNALHDRWEVIRGHKPFSLSELAESIPQGFSRDREYAPIPNTALRVKTFEDTMNELQYHSRNCALFDNVRVYAYTVVRDHPTYESFYDAVLDRVISLNDNEIPKYFPIKIKNKSELKSIARSIATWTFEKRNQFRSINQGAMGFECMRGVYWEPEDFEKEILRRRSLAAERTNRLRRRSTQDKIREGVLICLKRGYEPTVSNLATLAQIHRTTIYRHKDEVNEYTKHYGKLYKGLL